MGFTGKTQLALALAIVLAFGPGATALAAVESISFSPSSVTLDI